MKKVNFKPINCPGCKGLLDAMAMPEEFDSNNPKHIPMTICVHCSACLLHSKEGVTLITENEIEKMPTHIMAAIHFAKENLKKFTERRKSDQNQ